MRRRPARRRPLRRPREVHKANGIIHPRVQRVGPEHFGIVCVDPAKARSYWMLADFYGKILVDKSVMEHTRLGFDQALQVLRKAIEQHGILDLTVSIERTGNYHVPPKREFQKAGYETRMIHPYATKQFRTADQSGLKTDERDLCAHHRATINGFGLLEPPLDPHYVRLQLLTRHRRDLVTKRATLRNQIHEQLNLIMPGYAKCFEDIFDSNIALLIARHTGSAAAVRQAGLSGLTEILKRANVRFQARTLHKILVWAAGAADGLPESDMRRQIFISLEDDRQAKNREIVSLERQSAGLLAQTPYVLLMSIVGINVVSCAEFAAEMGPIPNYASGQSIKGRAGLFPSRAQSDEVDRANGPLVHCANRKLRGAIMLIADNLVSTNDHFGALAQKWEVAGRDDRAIRVGVAARFCRIAYHMVAGRMVFNHPSGQRRDWILDKLITFHRDHYTSFNHANNDVHSAALQLSSAASSTEEPLLASELAKLVVKRNSKARCANTRGPQQLGDILLDVLIQRGFTPVESSSSGE